MTQADITEGTILMGKYRVQRQLGQGGMGTVYLVQHLKTDERMAMKVLNQSVAGNDLARERFRREARAPARIDSDHVVRVFDSDIAAELDGAPFIVMEYLRGQNLQVLSDQTGPLPPKEVVTYLRQTAMALDKAHDIGIVHRDLKPENLYLVMRDDGTPMVKLLDFGVAKITGAAADLARQRATATGTIFGTPLYMSPEQCKSETDKVGPQTDVWALGLIAHRLLTGRDFWQAATLTLLIAQIAYEPIPLASTQGSKLGRGFDLWFATCCAREASERFTSAGEAVKALAAAIEVAPHAQPSGVFAAVEAAGDAFVTTDESGPLKQTVDALALDREAPSRHEPRRGRSWLWLVAIAAVVVSGGALLFSGVFTTSSVSNAQSNHEPSAPAPSSSASTTPSAVPSAAAAPRLDARAASSVDAGVAASAAVSPTVSASAAEPPPSRPPPPSQWRPPPPPPPPPPPTAAPAEPPPPEVPVPAPPRDPLSGRH